MNAQLLIGGLLLTASGALFAQAPQSGAPLGAQAGMRPCAQEPDPAKCESRRKEMREHLKAARETCKGKQGRQRGQCIAQQMCAQAPDPARCLSNAKDRMEQRQKMRDRAAPKT